MKHVYLILSLALCGCASDRGSRQALLADSDRCRTIGLLVAGVDPGRPYRIIGALRATGDGAPSDRLRALQDQACKLGAEAVIEVREELRPNGNGFGTAGGDKVWTGEDGGSLSTIGTGVVFTDGRPPPAPLPPRYIYP